MISALDDSVGEIIQTLERMDLENDTLVLFFSDNGPAGPGSSGPLRGRKASLWEGGHRVPAIASWPGMISANSETDETVMTMDIFPTLVSLADIDMPEHLKLDGLDLSQVLFDDEELPIRQLIWRFGEQRAVRDGHWKLLVNPRVKIGSILCDLNEDPGEETDLAGEFPEKVLELEIVLSRWEKQVTAGVERRS
jgi:arylsulfatase A-like enzyme